MLSNLQTYYQDLKVQMLDEISMWGLRMLGQMSYRCGETFNSGRSKDSVVGNIPCSIVLGDLKHVTQHGLKIV